MDEEDVERLEGMSTILSILENGEVTGLERNDDVICQTYETLKAKVIKDGNEAEAARIHENVAGVVL